MAKVSPLLLVTFLGLTVAGCLVVEGETEAPFEVPVETSIEAAPDADAATVSPDVTDAAPPESSACPLPRAPASATPADLVEHHAFMDVVLDEAGRSPRKRFTVPSDAVSVSVTVRGEPGLTYIVEEVTAPDGRMLVAAEPPGVGMTESDHAQLQFPGPFLSANRTYGAEGVAAALLPNNLDVELAAGEYAVRVAAVDELGWPARSVVQINVQVLRALRPRVERRLDVHLHLTGARDWTAADASCDDAFRDLLRTLHLVFRDAGVELGEVSLSDVPRRFQRADLESLGELFAHSRRETGVPVFLVGTLSTDDGMTLGGVAGGVPGPIGLPGSMKSGVAVATAVIEDPHEIGRVVAHEVGHYLGLFHPTEAGGRYHDQLDDTPEDEAARGNIMFLAVGDPVQRFSPQQAEVIAGSPALLRVEPVD